MVAPPLRVVVLTADGRLAAWQRRALELLRAGGDAEIVGVVRDASRTGPPRRRRRGDELWQLYNNRWVVRRSRAVQRASADDLLGDVPRRDVTPTLVGQHSQHFPPDALAWLRQLHPDVIVRFGFGILRGEVLEVARHGVWSFHHDDERVIRGGPPSFWEVHDQRATTGVLLQRLTDRLDAGVPLARATFRTVGHSYPRNRDRAAFGAAVLPARVARAVRHGWFDPGAEAPATTDAPIRRNPSNRQMLAHLGRQGGRIVAHVVRSVTVGATWRIAVAPTDDPSSPGTATRWSWLPDRRAGYHADPFPARRDGVSAVLVEDFAEASGRAAISAFVGGPDAPWRLVEGVIEPGSHASYPFLVEADDELWCIPETARLGRVEAWRCRRFPDRWERSFTLLDEPVLDPTVARWLGRWWLFGGRAGGVANTELWLWSADELSGPWRPHPLNPVKLDVTSSRPAGTPFVRDGRLIRPAQDCSSTYGGAVVLNEVVAMDDKRFEERVVDRLEPPAGRYGGGTHTRSHGGGMIAIDAKRATFDRRRTWRELSARLRRRPTTLTP